MQQMQRIACLKQEQGAVIAAHTYQSPAVQSVADILGDSFALAKKAAATDAQAVYMCGVRFMAEGVKILCPDKRVALGVILTEVDPQGNEYPRGTKAITVPAHHFPTCRDVLVQCIKFVLPEDLDVSGGSPFALCNTRNFKVRVIAHNIDSDFACCNGTIV